MGGILSAFVFVLSEVVGGVFKFVGWAGETLFHPRLWNLPEGKGLMWKYLYWCFKIGLYFLCFTLGGVGITFIGILYVYTKLYKRLKTPQNENELTEKEYYDNYKKYGADNDEFSLEDLQVSEQKREVEERMQTVL
jgi:hypothetical protein